MSNALLTITYADVPGFPAGSAVANIVASITNASDVPPVTTSQAVPPGTATVSFINLDPGDYVASVAGVDASGATLGTPVAVKFNVPTPTTVTLSLPASVDASVS